MSDPQSPSESVSPEHWLDDGFDVIGLSTSPGISAGFAPRLGMTCCSLCDQGTELLDHRHGLPAYDVRGMGLGLSLLHPWAGHLSRWGYSTLGRDVQLPITSRLHTDGTGLPLNGVLCRNWTIDTQSSGGRTASIEATLAFDEDPRLLEIFPFPHRLHFWARLTDHKMTVNVAIEATGDTEVPVCFGYQAHLSVGSEVSTSSVTLPERDRLETDDRNVLIGEAEIVPAECLPLTSAPMDETFLCLDPTGRIALDTDGRRVRVETDGGFPFGRVNSSAGTRALSVELMTAEPDALNRGTFRTAAPGRPYFASLSIATDAPWPRDRAEVGPTVTADFPKLAIPSS